MSDNIREGHEFWDRLCAIPHFGFLLSPSGKSVQKMEGIGSWIDRDAAMQVVDAAQEEVNELRAALSQQPAPAAVPDGCMLVTPEQLEKHTTTAWECSPQSLVVLVSSLKRLHSKNAAAPTPVAAPVPAVRMCMTMQRPVAECGCPDCGSALIDWPVQDAPAPEAQEPVIGWAFHNPDSGWEWHEDHPVKSGMAEDATSIRRMTLQQFRERYGCADTAPPAAEQPDTVPAILTDEDMRRLRRFQEICEDSDAGGHDLPKEAVKRLERAGVLRSCGFGRHEVTLFGDYLLGKESA